MRTLVKITSWSLAEVTIDYENKSKYYIDNSLKTYFPDWHIIQIHNL